MKKITLLAMSFVMALTVSAQNAAVDVTSTFENTDFEGNSTSGWETTGWTQGTAAANNYEGTYYLETWVASSGNLANFDWYQTQEVPNGYYLVKALAHAIKQNQATTPESKGVYLYAGDKQVEIKSTVAAEYTLLVKVTEGSLTIGYRAENCNVNWTACDYFRILQCDGDTEEEAKTSWAKYETEELAIVFEELLEQPMSKALKDAMGESIKAKDEVATYAEAYALWQTMKQQEADANACIEAYAQLTSKLDAIYEYADQQGADDLFDLLDAVDEKVKNGEYDAAGALAEIVAINDAVFQYNLENADGSEGFDVTEMFVKNPSVRTKEQTEGWTITVTNNANAMPAFNYDCIEFWSCDFEMSQTITDLPNGKYVVKLQGFYREGGNDKGASHAAGTEVITAELFANNSAKPFTSMYAYTADEMGVTVNLRDGYVNGLESAGLAFSTLNSLTGRNYYDDNEVTVIVTDGTLTFGARNKSNVGDRWCIFRDFELWYYGNFPAVNLYGKCEDIKAYIRDNVQDVPYAVNVEMMNYVNSLKGYTEEGAYSEEEVNEVIFALDEKWAAAQEAIALFADVKALKTRIENELLPLGYPGKNDLQAALVSMAPYLSETSEVNTYEGMQTLVAQINEAIRAYYFSQVATPEIAADYSFLIPNPNFEKKGNWTWSVAGGGSDQWNGRCRPTEEGGASRQGVNLWGWGITSVDVHQILTDLPDGLYKVSAEMITQTNYATDQHVYAASATKATSDALAVEGWDTYEWTELTTNDFAVVVGGRLSIGAESSIGGTNSEGWFQATNFKLYYHGPASAEQLKAAWDDTEARANDALEILIPNERKELAAAMLEATPLAAEEKYGDACALVTPLVLDLDSTITATKNFYGGYYARLDTLENREGYETCDSTHAFVEIVLAMVDEILASDTATCKLFDGLADQVYAYYNYASSLRDAEYLITDESYLEQYRTFVADSVVRPQVEVLLSTLCDVEYCEEVKAILDEANGILKGTANMAKEINEGDVTGLIINATIDVVEGESLAGWTIQQNNAQNCGTNQSEHYSGVATNTYLDAWHPNAGTMNATFYQDIIGIPDGTYKLTVAARTDGDNAFIFACTTASGIKNDTTAWAPVTNYAAWRGDIWEADSLAWVAAGSPSLDENPNLATDYPYFMARPDSTGYGAGYGWSWIVIENIEVTNHFLSVGLTADASLSGANFTGTWMGADDWKLELVKKNEVQSEYDPFANFNKKDEEEEEEDLVEKIEVAPAFKGIYDLFGRRVDAITAPGLYIVNGKKVLVK